MPAGGDDARTRQPVLLARRHRLRHNRLIDPPEENGGGGGDGRVVDGEARGIPQRESDNRKYIGVSGTLVFTIYYL